MTFEEIVRDYRSKYDRRLDAELEAYKRKATLEDAIRDASRGLKANGRRHIHQRFLPRRTAHRVSRILLANVPALRAARDFHALQELVHRLVGHMPWAKKLYIYDTTFRFGGKLAKRPTRVYLHRGTCDGAVALGFDRNREFVSMRELPKPLQELRAYEVEDLLCLYKDDLVAALAKHEAQLNRTDRRRRGRC